MPVPLLQEKVKGFETPYLLEQYVHFRDQYTEEAQQVLAAEIASRNISQGEIDEFAKKSLIGREEASGNVQVRHFRRDEFEKLEGVFTRKDMLLVRSMFSEEEVPFFMDTSVQFSPVQQQASREYVSVYVHKDSKDKALALIGAHFECTGGLYGVKCSDVRERLKLFSFDEIQQSEVEAAQIVDVSFSPEEKDVLVVYGKRLLGEIDDIESRDGRIVFHFDNVEGLVERLSSRQAASLSKTDLLTALEILQIYCDDAEFSPTSIGIAEALLSFFLQ
jgi:hypothetical protein